MKKVCTIIILVVIPLAAYSQSAYQYKEKASLSVSLYWEKYYALIETDRLKEAKVLLDELVQIDSVSCKVLRQHYQSLAMSLDNQRKSEALQSFTFFIVNGIMIDLQTLQDITLAADRSKKLRELYKELITTQRYIKQYDFLLYRQLVSLLRQLNQRVDNSSALLNTVKESPLIQEMIGSC